MATQDAGQLLISVDGGSEEDRVRLFGELDDSNAAELSRVMQSVLAQGSSDIVLDLSNVRFCDVQGVRLIVRSAATAREQGRTLKIVGAPAILAEALSITGDDIWVNLDGSQRP
jgi:anti-anti-sigma factor